MLLFTGAITIGLVAMVMPVRFVVLVIVGLILLGILAHPELGFLMFPIAAVCLPAIPQFLPPRGLFPEELVLAALVLSLAMRRGKRLRVGGALGAVNWLLMVLAGSQLVTLLLVAFRWGVTHRDTFEVFRTLKYFVVFNVARTSNGKAARWAVCGINSSLICAAVVGFLQYFNPRGIGELLIVAYGKPSALRFLSNIQRASGQWRVPGTLGNPNAFGYMLVVVLIGVFAGRNCLAVRRGRCRGAMTFALYLTGLVVLLLTRSRTAALGAIAVLTIFWGTRVFAMKYHNRLIPFVVATLCLIIASCVGGVVPVSRLRDMESAAKSLNYRVEIWSRVVDTTTRESLLFGLGPEKLTEVERFEEIDSEFVSFLKRWGVVGFLVYLALLAAIGYRGYRLVIRGCTRSEKCRGASILALSVVASIVSLTGGLWSRNQISDLCFFLLGILESARPSEARAITQDVGSISERMLQGA